jgi:hypothetical protein
MPKKTLWWGIALAVGGAIFIVTAPPLLPLILPLNTETGQTAYFALFAALDVVRELVLPIGAALIGAALVMFYVDRRLRDEGVSERPKRWLLPDARTVEPPRR